MSSSSSSRDLLELLESSGRGFIPEYNDGEIDLDIRDGVLVFVVADLVLVLEL